MRLCKPDAPAWHAKRGHSDVIAHVLTAHFAALEGHAPTQPGLAARYDALKRYAVSPMCHRQRVCMYLSMGMLCIADGGDGLDEAFDWLEAALTLAEELDDLLAMPQLFYLHGVAESWKLCYRLAADDLAKNRLRPPSLQGGG
jgi:hypothetical protein